MTVGQLRAKHLELFGEECRSNHKDFLFKRITWRMQAVAEGGLSERARQRAMELANDANLRIRAPKDAFADTPAADPACAVGARVEGGGGDARLPMPGQMLTRMYKDRIISVQVRENGFEFDGKIYKSLSSVARAVTGTRWNGFLFFGIAGGKDAASA
ncbi:MAG: DUF2924 domain-containing protein [Bryobacterales bacterium]|nr:DUF2924 domain-containing protein [Bryobacterales bacterium]